MKKLQEKLDFLCEKYELGTHALLKDEKTVKIGEKEYPLLSHRAERRFAELKNIALGGTLKGISVMRVQRITGLGADVYEELKREADICRFVLGEEICSVMVMRNDNVLNAVLKTKGGIVITIEIAATLKNGAEPKDKHEIISQRGIACDIVVDAQLKQDSVYLYGESEEKFTDVDYELYGLSIPEIATVRAAFGLASSGAFAEAEENGKCLEKIIEAAKKSEISGEREEVLL